MTMEENSAVSRSRKRSPFRRPWRFSGRFPLVLFALVVALPPGRLHPADIFNRWVSLEGAWNFRDVGGYDAGTTAMVAVGKVFRSGALSNLTTTDALVIQSLGIHVVIDLRTQAEFTSLPDSPLLDPFAAHVFVPISFPSGTDMADIYARILTERTDQLRLVFGVLANPANYPLDFHCQAGKDRAGIVAALLLTLLGVDRETVIQDYMLSEVAYWPGVVEREWIEAVLDEVDAAGGIDAYFDSIGVGESEREAIRAGLLVERPASARATWQLY